MTPTRWKYHSENVGGNVHEAVFYVNKCLSDKDVVSFISLGGGHAIVVWREPVNAEEEVTNG
jgi:hypothetical protein